ncbi:MAG TPA: M42 family metallopeptidase [Phycisphaerae bacterium]|jgi:putative aminopeptidase FrvX|nr:M42 family metallopeptidase [Phycisphaerae bacterium]HOB74866.1 M42 family metallopeptidase [Phycisphaerae bacterium]HOJ53728.1 M42 family metallopeptidase [Phycisphaerae bacterium]HOL27952.1 M42 family metallopeptidase [Phycisphaerae bacterium]HPP22212.1 M42 family metallopeptidase [Phycisphaerae bacterium]
MQPESFEFLKTMEETPSVSGFEQPVGRVIRKRMKRYADEITTDVHGNTIVTLNPKGKPRVMLAGHYDQIGLMVKWVNDEGYIYFGTVGGIDPTVLPGARVTIHSRKGPVEGVIGRKPIHLMKPEERGQAKIEIQDLWIDIGAANKEQALKRVSVADPVTYRLGLERLGDDLITSPGLDNKVGAFVVMEALRLLSERTIKCALYAVATVQEELGLRGARTSCYGIDPLVGIAVDVTHATDNPGADKKLAGDVALGKGPVIDLGANINPALGELFIETAKSKKIPYQIAAAPGATGTDANAIQISRAGVAAGLISIPNRYMHTQVEVVSLADLENAAKLLAETVARIDAKTDFTPR